MALEPGLTLLQLLAYVLIGLGLIGSVVPVLPGPFLIWFGAFIWAWDDNFNRVGWPTLIVLGLIALLAWASDLFLTTVISRRSGASWKAIGGAIVGGLIGGILLSGVVVLGTVLGALIGALGGMWLVEYWDKRNSQAAAAAVKAYAAGVLLAALVEMTLALVMLGIFIWQAFLYAFA
jgi:uncharacterized protein YqgC (DUF456 family)